MDEGRNPANRAQRGPLGRAEIECYLRLLGRYLHKQGLIGEILLVGGAYMTLVLCQREASKDVDALGLASATQALAVVSRSGT